ncbi:S-layer glycoprotein N-glycosyltransferase AglJ [Halorhabdus sp. CBA1104]|uniref:S-layer glycoprotein N-glycosyltransferase AglJ n=1 Tax=Halorhabdus sp. CBA1104 TaxID=1380432 RepID=UPI0012B3409D|nr:S-layer glycoprotein N-glycosyltransferase AglJ [Halorhabdus sp. CBA1104]QGN06514.1 S-layer glycoprotein N-glycosyltransferase AglJ [Halorhabdus sp. CBA1104]
MADYDDVCVLIPTYNEEGAIGKVLSSFRAEGFDNILVIDGGSEDKTPTIAADHGADVVQQSGSGKGQAVREAFALTDAPYVLMLDGDWTYRAEDADAMLEPLFEGRADHVIGDRFADMEAGAMSRLNQVGNTLINTAFRHIHGREYGDILSGYRALTREAIERVTLTEDGFGIETELAVECVKHNVQTEVVPIVYRSRPGEAETNLRPIRDGATIFLTLYRMAKTNNPLFYFGSVGIASLLGGLGLGGYVAVEWFTRGISHEVMAFLSGIALIFGVQLLMFGTLSDMIVKLHREQMQRLDRALPEEGKRSGAGHERPASARRSQTHTQQTQGTTTQTETADSTAAEDSLDTQNETDT